MPNERWEISLLAVGNTPDLNQAVQRVLAAPGFSGETCVDPDRALSDLSRKNFDVVLCELDLPGMGGLSLLTEIRRRFPHTSVLVITSLEDADQALLAAQAGASDYLVRPLRADTLMVRIHRAAAVSGMERELEHYRLTLGDDILGRIEQLQGGLERVERTWDETLGVLGHALGLRDNETAQHCQRVTLYSVHLARALHCFPDEIRAISRGAFLHDIGKLGIPDAILRKPGPLTTEERVVMETHVRIGHEMVRRISFLAPSAEIVLSHHERFDGSGYPEGLAGREIPLGARIFAVADTLDAITSHRPYRLAQPYPVARDEIIRQSGRQFDPEVVQVFRSIPLSRWEEIYKRVRQRATNPDQHWWMDVK